MLFTLKMYLFLILILGTYIECLKVVFERANVTYFNKKYMSSVVMNIRRYSRKSPYYLNVFGTLEHRWENNITIDIIFNQYLHNEYRRSFIEFHYKFCDFINKEPYMGGMLKYAGLECPMEAGPHAYMNMTAPTNNFPNVFPFEKGRVDAALSITATKEPVFTLFVEASFTN